ncbi:MAG: DUF4854 domain-containing protein [Pseudobutyrivibrio sp.]|nr:DUF4854 domain-containing protein [Pseudobutyrivibrio sp.]
MKNLAKILVGTMLASALFMGCGGKDEAVEDTKAVEAQDDKKVEEAEKTTETEEKVEEKTEEESATEEAKTLEDYFNEHPDELKAAIDSSSSAANMDIDIKCEGNTMIYYYNLGSLTDDQIAKAKEAMTDDEWEKMATQMESAKKLMAPSIGVNVEDITMKVVYTDDKGTEILSHEF